MHEILRNLPAGSLVLDLGCAAGSFPETATRAAIVRLDREAPAQRTHDIPFVQADASMLPFADHTFSAVISNHSLEHIEDLNGALSEIGRVINPSGSLYVAVPDASTLTDKLYRWLASGGGHVNAFTSPSETAALIERTTHLRQVACRLLFSSLSFLNRHNSPRPIPRRLLLLGAGYEWSLFLYASASRWLDRRLNTRTSVYGWAFYFGTIAGSVDTSPWVNVCIRCGSASSASSLLSRSLVGSVVRGFRTFRCPECNATNPFAEDPATIDRSSAHA